LQIRHRRFNSNRSLLTLNPRFLNGIVGFFVSASQVPFGQQQPTTAYNGRQRHKIRDVGVRPMP